MDVPFIDRKGKISDYIKFSVSLARKTLYYRYEPVQPLAPGLFPEHITMYKVVFASNKDNVPFITLESSVH
jgi:hypothetical protein